MCGYSYIVCGHYWHGEDKELFCFMKKGPWVVASGKILVGSLFEVDQIKCISTLVLLFIEDWV